MNEPAVTLTDFALAGLCAAFAVALARSRAPGASLGGWFVAFFAAASAASLLGALVHGFYDTSTKAGGMLWPATLLAIGAGAFAAEGVALRLACPPRAHAPLTRLSAAKLALYAGLVLSWSQAFWLAIANYVPSALLLLAAFRVAHRAAPRPGLRSAALGLAVTLLAAIVQRLGLQLHAQYFDHNVLYHLVQALGFALLFTGAKALVAPGESRAHAA